MFVKITVELNSEASKHEGENGVKEKEVLDKTDGKGEEENKEEKKKQRRHILALVKVRVLHTIAYNNQVWKEDWAHNPWLHNSVIVMKIAKSDTQK